MRNMGLSRIYFRSLVISLAILLTVVDLTKGFTLRERQQDLVAAESTKREVINDSKPSNEISLETTNRATANDEPMTIIPIETQQDTKPVATNATGNTEPAAEQTESTLVENVSTEATKFASTTKSTNDSVVNTTNNSGTIPTLETTVAPETEKNDMKKNTVKSTENEHTSRKKIGSDNIVIADVNSTAIPTVTEQPTNSVITTSDSIQLQTSTNYTEKDKIAIETVTTKATTKTTTAMDMITMGTPTTETSTPVTTFNVTPVWKKYTTILRNRVNNTVREDTPPTAKLTDSINAHTTESRITLEKVLALSPDIQSLQDLKNNLMETSNVVQTPRSLDTTVDTRQTEVITPKTTREEVPTLATVEGNQTMVSMRAGFLNHSNTDNTTIRREIQLDGVLYEIVPQEEMEHKSHSQLAEDAIKEELLEESVINDKEVNSIRYRSTPSLNAVTSKLVPDLPNITEETVSELKTQDELSVKPISPEKKNTNLYAVNPNYKPLKKIDVQPPKPFTRDPDDNSWRNESLTSLGIVFKANNASKAFTEVLKNKTETVLNNMPELNKTIEKFELRDRLEKIAEKRKSKKKKVDKFGNTEYTDYEENNSGDSHTSKETSVDAPSTAPPVTSTEVSSTENAATTVTVPSVIENHQTTHSSTKKPNKYFNLQDYYDTTDEDDYAKLPNIDIMKSTVRPRVQWPVTQRILEDTTPKPQFPDRQPTVQYFPPLPKPSTVNVNDYENVFKGNPDLFNTNTRKPTPVDNPRPPLGRFTGGISYPTESNYRNEKNPYASDNIHQAPVVQVQYTPVVAGAVYLTEPPKASPAGFIIRHYKDFIDAAIKDSDYDRNAYLYTESPVTGVTAGGKMAVKSDESDYERKELVKFVDNFNQNHEQFKVDFPVLFNSSIVHKHGQDGGKVLASSSATFKRLYEDATATKANGFHFSGKPYDPHCENVSVELAPAYELHYYVPDQEETEEQSKATLPFGYRL